MVSSESDIRYGRQGGAFLPKVKKRKGGPWSPPKGLPSSTLEVIYRHRNSLCTRCEKAFDATGPLITPYWALDLPDEEDHLLCRSCCHEVADAYDKADAWPQRNPILEQAA